jgi:hypothetical protein
MKTTPTYNSLFRFVPNIDALPTPDLRKHLYYRGAPCAHGHVIRDVNDHWCYHCVQKIVSNVCGFDINYLHVDYKVKYETLWKRLQIASFSECWDQQQIKSRFCFPSYRSFWSKQKSENVCTHKLVYQCAWGDVGSLTVKRLCGNPDCLNPLHMVSKWNNNVPPNKIIPFFTTFDYAKLAYAASRETQGAALDIPTQQQFKKSITYPTLVEYPEE